MVSAPQPPADCHGFCVLEACVSWCGHGPVARAGHWNDVVERTGLLPDADDLCLNHPAIM